MLKVTCFHLLRQVEKTKHCLLLRQELKSVLVAGETLRHSSVVEPLPETTAERQQRCVVKVSAHSPH